MTSAERQRRFLARIREQARRQAKPIAAPAEKTIRLQHLAMDPVRFAEWIHRELGPDATRAIRKCLRCRVAGEPLGVPWMRALSDRGVLP